MKLTVNLSCIESTKAKGLRRKVDELDSGDYF